MLGSSSTFYKHLNLERLCAYKALIMEYSTYKVPIRMLLTVLITRLRSPKNIESSPLIKKTRPMIFVMKNAMQRCRFALQNILMMFTFTQKKRINFCSVSEFIELLTGHVHLATDMKTKTI